MTAGPGDAGERMVRADVVADKLGVHVRTVRRWAAAGKLPCIRPGKIYLFSGAWFDALPAASKVV
jgi:excisionase family DNA binding protein